MTKTHISHCASTCDATNQSPGRALVEGFGAAFETQLDAPSRATIKRGLLAAFMSDTHTHGGQTQATAAAATKAKLKDLERPPQRPKQGDADAWVCIGPFWLACGGHAKCDWSRTSTATGLKRSVLTETVQQTLRDLARAVAVSDSPILLQGPTR